MQLIIVQRGQFATFELLARMFADDPDLRVVPDRRGRDRREHAHPTTADRRRQDRRSAPPDSWSHHHYILVRAEAEEVNVGQDSAPSALTDAADEPPAFRDIRLDVECAARADLPVLISGGDDSSRKSLAYLIHQRSERRDNAFVILDAAGALKWLTENDTGASTASGRLTAAAVEGSWLASVRDGTVCIEEVGDLSSTLQQQLLALFERRAARYLENGGQGPRDARLVAATGYELLDRLESKSFSTDLFYRLNMVHVVIPSGLGERLKP